MTKEVEGGPVQFLRNECSFFFLSFYHMLILYIYFFSVSTHYALVFRVSKHVKTKSISLAPFCVHRTLSLSTLTHSYYWHSNKCHSVRSVRASRSPEFLLPLGPEIGHCAFCRHLHCPIYNSLKFSLHPDLGSYCLYHLSIQ